MNIEISDRLFHFRFAAGTSRGVYTTRRSWFVTLTDDEGRTGVGECAPLPDLSCDALPDYERILREMANQVQQSGVIPYSQLLPYPSMLFGLETALWQLGHGFSALDEELIGVNLAMMKEELLDTIRPQYIILKPSLHGGMSGCEEWIEMAQQRGIGSWVTSALESNIGLNAIAHFTAAVYGPHITMPQGLGTGQIYSDNIPMPLEIRGEQLWTTKAGL